MITQERYGPWAVIAGGSEGVGASFALRLARAGINLVLLARKAEPLAETANAVQQESDVRVRTLQVDLTRPDMIDLIRKVTDDIDVGMLIYNAGGATGPKLLLDQSADEALTVVKLNVIGQTLLAQHFGRLMAARGHGGIIFISSLASVAGSPSLATYSASKAYTQLFGESLWAELKPLGVEVLVVMLGPTRTPALVRSQVAGHGAVDPDEMAAQALANLHDGPVYVPPHLLQTYQRFTSMSRREATEAMSKALRAQLRQ